MYQTLSGLVTGQQYAVTFWMARRNGNVGANNSNAVSVLADNLTIMAPTYSPDEVWRSYTTGFFTATADSMRITFQGQIPTSSQTDTASLIDDVSLSPVPEPTSSCAFALGAIALLRRRSSKR